MYATLARCDPSLQPTGSTRYAAGHQCGVGGDPSHAYVAARSDRGVVELGVSQIWHSGTLSLWRPFLSEPLPNRVGSTGRHVLHGAHRALAPSTCKRNHLPCSMPIVLL